MQAPQQQSLYGQVNVRQGSGCDISPFCSLENVVLGDNVTIRDSVQLKNVVVGSHTRLSRGVTLYSADAEQPVRIGERCWLGYGVFGEATGGAIQIGDYVAIAHCTTMLTSSAPGGPGAYSPLLRSFFPLTLGPVVIGSHCWIGAQAVLLPQSELEEGVVVGANSMVPGGKLPGWAVFMGTPVKPVRKLDPAAVEELKQKFLRGELE